LIANKKLIKPRSGCSVWFWQSPAERGSADSPKGE